MRVSTVFSFVCLTVLTLYYAQPVFTLSLDVTDGFNVMILIIFVQSIVGIIRYAELVDDSKIEQLYFFTLIVRQVSILPAFLYQIAVNGKVSDAWLYAILITWGVVLTKAVLEHSDFKDIVRMLQALQTILLATLCFEENNLYGINACLTFVFAHFVVTDQYTYMDLPAVDIYNYLLCFYIFFCSKALIVEEV